MTTLNEADFIALFRSLADAIERDKDRLSALDGAIGDGDHGVTMSIGFQAVARALDAMPTDQSTPSQVMMLVARTFLNAVGASTGPLYATGFMRAAAAVKERGEIGGPEMADIICAIAEGITARGKAEPGQKTMVDAWQPACEAARAAKQDGSLESVVQAAAEAARAGADATAAMKPGKGRSVNLGDRAVGHVDPGAASAALLLETMNDWLHKRDDAV